MQEKASTPQELLDWLTSLAPFVEATAQQLLKEGWEEFYSFRPFYVNGSPNVEDIEYALQKVPSTTEGRGNFQYVCAKDEVDPVGRIFHILKKSLPAIA